MALSHALLLTAPRTLEWRTQSTPDLSQHEVLVRTLYSALSVGTELPLYQGTSRNPALVTYPKMTGYETYGVVEAVGEAVRDVQVGERVVTGLGHVTHAVAEASSLIRIPSGLDPRLALLTILSNDVKKGVLKVNPQPGERVLVTGAGTIGLLTLFILRAFGVTQVDVVEPVAGRQSLAYKLGAQNVYTPEEIGALQGDTYEVGTECSSRNAAFTLLQDKLKPAGRICVLADGNLEPLELSPQFHQKELRVVGSSDGENYPEHARWFLNLPDLSKLSALFELIVDAEALPQTFEALAEGEVQPIKVLVRYNASHEAA